MKEQKYHIYLTNQERSEIIESLIDFKNLRTEWYVDKYGDLRADATHHDGTNHYLYRVFKDGVSETQMENLRDKIYHGKATRADITRLTRRLGDEIAAVYGFDIPKQRVSQERSER